MSQELADRNALITGGTRGLGLEIARAYLQAGAHGVCICGRDVTALNAAAAELETLAEPGQQVLALPADVSKPEEAQSLVERAIDALGELTILVSNAGVYGPKGMVEQVDWADWVRAIEVNLFGPVLMVRAVMPHFISRTYGKIIQVSGGGEGGLRGLSAYAASKAAVVRFVETMADESRERGVAVDINAIAPGALNTRMLDEVLAAGPERVGKDFHQRALKQQRSGGVPPRRAAELAVFLGSDASDGITGKLLSAVWDPWAELAERKGDLDSDIYTVRRIVPGDRGLEWGGR
ncbi:MAG TPA: SDR family oxidoreductase [Solirubrobacteraceae bacterium]|jgi:NAD(P)-dependent dehydrogenase (short-subunit alcohol dehydrogenase family)